MTSPLRSFWLLAVGAFVSLPAVSLAHPGHDGHDLTWDFTAGAMHPVMGLDHLVALVAVGLWAALLGGRARWLLPSAFLAALAFGGWFGLGATPLSWTEYLLATSVVIFGLGIAASRYVSTRGGLVLSTGFAVFHGFAHGAEMPSGANVTAYGAGLLVATLTLLGLGLALGLLARRDPLHWQRLGGAAIASVGAVLLSI